MKDLIKALLAEFIKLKRNLILWLVWGAFSLVPIMGGVIMYLIKHPDIIPKTSILSMKLSLLSTPVNWYYYFSSFILQGSGLVGIIAFGFVASFLFGREYSDMTYRDLLSLPVSRITILNAKFIIYLLIAFFLALWALCLGFVVGLILNLSQWDRQLMVKIVKLYFIVSFMTTMLGTWCPFFALWTRGYLAPLGFLIVILMFSQFAPYLGIGHYFPWSIPAIFSGMAGEELKRSLNFWSYFLLIFTSLSGYITTLVWWKYSDQP